MFREILVPVDLTPKNERAVQMARDLATSFGARIVLLHVIELLDLPFEELEEFYARLQARAITHMEGLSQKLAAAEVPFEVHVEYGDRTQRILLRARERGSDLIVMESHVVGPDRGPTTISYRVAVAAECPILLVKGERSRSPTT